MPVDDVGAVVWFCEVNKEADSGVLCPEVLEVGIFIYGYRKGWIIDANVRSTLHGYASWLFVGLYYGR